MELRIRPLTATDWSLIVPDSAEPVPAIVAAQKTFGCVGYEVCIGPMLGRVLLIPAHALPELPTSGAHSAFVAIQAYGNRAAVAVAFQRVLAIAASKGITVVDAVAGQPNLTPPASLWISPRARLIDLDFTTVAATPHGTHMRFEMSRLVGLQRIRASIGQIIGLLLPQRLPQAHATRSNN